MTVDITLEIVLRLVAAMVMGAVIGLNRQLRHKPAGLRTHALVAVGAAAITAAIATTTTYGEPMHVDAVSRVMQGIITGIGFLGAGVILRTTGGRTVHGLTTAASIWLVGCLGCTCGIGAWQITITAFLLMMFVLIVGGPIERWVVNRSKTRPEDQEEVT